MSSQSLNSTHAARPDAFLLEDEAGWRGFLAREGYVVIRQAVSRARAEAHLQAMWGLMEALGTVRRDRPESWRRAGSWPPMLHGGMIQYMGHTAPQWEARGDCAALFARYYGCAPDQLATSMDGLCFMHGARNYQKAGELVSFLHTDQSPLRKGEWSIQGLLSVGDGGPQDGGLVVVPGSHLRHEAFFQGHAAAQQKGDWYLFSAAEQARYRDEAVKVCVEPGDVALWDSRTFHCNTVPVRKDAIRACLYVCMIPQRRVASSVRAKRAQAWADRRVSSHHPGDGFRLFPVLPRFVLPSQESGGRDGFTQRVRDLQVPALTPLGESLLCRE